MYNWLSFVTESSAQLWARIYLRAGTETIPQSRQVLSSLLPHFTFRLIAFDDSGFMPLRDSQTAFFWSRSESGSALVQSSDEAPALAKNWILVMDWDEVRQVDVLRKVVADDDGCLEERGTPFRYDPGCHTVFGRLVRFLLTARRKAPSSGKPAQSVICKLASVLYMILSQTPCSRLQN